MKIKFLFQAVSFSAFLGFSITSIADAGIYFSTPHIAVSFSDGHRLHYNSAHQHQHSYGCGHRNYSSGNSYNRHGYHKSKRHHAKSNNNYYKPHGNTRIERHLRKDHRKLHKHNRHDEHSYSQRHNRQGLIRSPDRRQHKRHHQTRSTGWIASHH